MMQPTNNQTRIYIGQITSCFGTYQPKYYLSEYGLSLSQLEYNSGMSGACPGFLKGGGSNIYWFPKKRSSDFKRGGSNGLKGGSSTFVSLGRQILHI